MKVEVIIVAAGLGTRLKLKSPKALIPLGGKPLIWYSLKIFEGHPGVNGIVVVAPGDFLAEFISRTRQFKKVRAVVAGGRMRSDSVKRGLQEIAPETKIVLVHDAARPFVDNTMIDRLLSSLKKNKAAIVGVPVKCTVKKVNGRTMNIEETLPRHLLWEAQTPQGFYKDILVRAHTQKIKEEITDDAYLVERMGTKVKMVMGDYRNIKITMPEDVILAKQFLSALRVARTRC